MRGRRPGWIGVAVVLMFAIRVVAQCPYGCGDLDGDQTVAFDDFAALADCLGEDAPFDPICECADQDGSGRVDLRDYALFTLIFDAVSDEQPPVCTGAIGSTANLTAYRPQHGAGYFPFTRTAVPDAVEDDALLGPGIRVNANGDADLSGEDDLIEIEVNVDPPGSAVALRRSNSSLRVWTTRDKQSGTEIPFIGDKTEALPIGPSDTQFTLWVEWAQAVHGLAELIAEPPTTSVAKDVLTFHSFEGIVVALGGENQPTSVPVDSNHGTYVVGIALYEVGYDVHMYDEDNVSADGSGAVYNAVADAIQNRMVSEVAIFGYSHGGGSTYDLADRLDVNRAGLGVFEITGTAYVDSVSNNSDIDTAMELRRPPSTGYHVNHYQHGQLFVDFALDGGPVTNSNPPPTGLDVETTPWGANSTHFTVDDYLEVRGYMETAMANVVMR